MDKNQFLEKLRQSLTGQVPEYEIQSNIRYYNEYISSYGNSKEAEEECIGSIGDPHLIAKTIIDAYEVKSGTGNRNRTKNYESYYEDSSNEDKKKDKGRVHVNINGNDVFPWYAKVLMILVPIAVVAIILFVGFFLLRIVLGIALPILLIFLVVQLITRLFQK
ncbi:hypothetical protein lbkm_3050 [Lachnospiraceae bacterium KM106-2]|nr:hypothetical protein lbkm_3050 [Lachnospiraceae bacterium KM106-2]